MLTPASRAQDFPGLAGQCYLNTAAEGLPPLCVEEAFHRYSLDRRRGSAGRDAHFAAWEEARRLAGDLIGLSVGEVGLCSCASEGFDLLSQAIALQPGDEVIVSDLDFPAGQTPWLVPGAPATPRIWRAVGGSPRAEELAAILSPRTRLVVASLVSYYNGAVLPLEEVRAAMVPYPRARLALDITQALGRIPIPPACADFILSSTHKWIMAVHGGGIVGIPAHRAEELTPRTGGWLHIPDAFSRELDVPIAVVPGAAAYMRGMPSFAVAYALRAALGYVSGVGVSAIHRAADPLVVEARRRLAAMPVELLTPAAGPRSGILAFRCPRQPEVFQSLRSAGIEVMQSAGRMRISLHGYNTEADVDRFAAGLSDALTALPASA